MVNPEPVTEVYICEPEQMKIHIFKIKFLTQNQTPWNTILQFHIQEPSMQITVGILFQIQNILESILQILKIKTVLKITSKLPNLKCQKLRMKKCFLLLKHFQYTTKLCSSFRPIQESRMNRNNLISQLFFKKVLQWTTYEPWHHVSIRRYLHVQFSEYICMYNGKNIFQ